MGDTKGPGSKGKMPDLAHFIRSMQRIEGKRDCFGKANGQCNQTDCCWSSYCLQGPEPSEKKKSESDKQPMTHLMKQDYKGGNMYRKIMVPLDGSELAECVLPHVEALMSQCQIPAIVFVRVIEPIMPTVEGDHATTLAELEKREGERRSGSESYLKQVAAKLSAGETIIDTAVMVGRAADRLTDYAENNGIDLILMATHGRSGVSRWVRGSVADRILRAASIPVLMVRAPGTAGQGQV
jgi:nucleotide-binding universal stress UspA family protein